MEGILYEDEFNNCVNVYEKNKYLEKELKGLENEIERFRFREGKLIETLYKMQIKKDKKRI